MSSTQGWPDLRKQAQGPRPNAAYGKLAPVRPAGQPSGLFGRPRRGYRPLDLLRRAAAKGSPLRRLDWLLLAAVLALSLVGALLVWSASKALGDPRAYLFKELLNIAIGLVLMFTVSMFDYRQIRLFAPFVYVLSCLGLIVVLSPFGAVVNGAHSWIKLPGGYEIEPSEYAKLAIIVISALILGELRHGDTRPRVRAVSLTIACAAVPILLVVLEPDLGVTVLMMVLLVGMIALSGIRLRWLVGLAAAAALGVVAVLNLHLLKAYQLHRLTSFLHPSADPRGTGYSAAQAKIAIGSGGLFGQGLFHGQLVAGNFVPEQQTDFIFTVAGEELGFVGSVVIISLFALILLRTLRIAARADDQFGMLVACGIAIWFAVQAFINIGMTIGITPVTGLPLPFVSYGGSALFADMIAIGVLQSVYRRRSVFSNT